MTLATERIRAGRAPCQIVEIDCDHCTFHHPAVAGTGDHSDTIAGYNLNRTLYSEDRSWWLAADGTIAAGTETPPDGVTDVTLATVGLFGLTVYANLAALTDNLQYAVSCYIKGGTSTAFSLILKDITTGFNRLQIDYTRAGAVWSWSADTVGTGGITSVGDGWYRCYGVVPINTIIGGNNNDVGFGLTGAGTTVTVSGLQVQLGTSVTEYQFENGRDGTSTNITLTTGGLASHNLYVSSPAIVNATTPYPVTKSGLGYVRVTGDASGEGTGTAIRLGTLICDADPTDEPCYNTRVTCQDEATYTVGTKTYRFCEPNIEPRLQVAIDALPYLRDVSYSPTSITPGAGLGPRASLTCAFIDAPHHDRGVDPYVDERTYDPMTQGTFWGKWRARNPYYQNRELRWLTGYATDPMDLTNNFAIRTFVMDKFTGPSSDARASVTAKDILKLADDKRAQCPTPNTGVLLADITAVAAALTLSPTGIGNSEYAASGTLRIGTECMTFTRVADAVTIVARGQNGTTAAAHSLGDAVQQCKVYSASTLDDVIYELLVTYAGIDSSYITTADWEQEVEDWLSGHEITTILTEPTGVKTLLGELCTQYMADIWWDDVDEKIRLRVLQPRFTTPDVLTDASSFLQSRIEVEDDPNLRVSSVYVRYQQIDPTKTLDDKANYRAGAGYADTDASSAPEYGEHRVKVVNSRWFSTLADAQRLCTRTVLNNRDNRRMISFSLDAGHDYEIGDVIQVSSTAAQDWDGSVDVIDCFITGVAPEMHGHDIRVEAVEEKWAGRYARITPSGMGNYSAATAEQKAKYGWILATTHADGPYLII